LQEQVDGHGLEGCEEVVWGVGLVLVKSALIFFQQTWGTREYLILQPAQLGIYRLPDEVAIGGSAGLEHRDERSAYDERLGQAPVDTSHNAVVWQLVIEHTRRVDERWQLAVDEHRGVGL